MEISVTDLMQESGVKFGTSGARGLATAMTDRVCHAYTTGFLQFLRDTGQIPAHGLEVAVGGDLRPSTGRILEAVCRAVEDFGGRPLHCGRVPSPALALFGFSRRIPSIMVTGSHIPDDRNGIKFNKPSGELLKSDEGGMTGQRILLSEDAFDGDGMFVGTRPARAAEDFGVEAAYVARYAGAFPGQPLRGLRLGVYQHSAVGRDILVRILRELGAEVRALGRSERFIPVDTEAIRPEDEAWARQQAAEWTFDALVSADGDSDRPLVSDELGEWLRGDVAGVLCARYLDADTVVTPVSSNTVVEKTGWFKSVRRTRIGSPFVVAAMAEAAAEGSRRVVGYEANGGFLIQSDLDLGGGARLGALPTRDAVVVMLAILLLARRDGCSVGELVRRLPARFTASSRLESFAIERSRRALDTLSPADEAEQRRRFEDVFGELLNARVTAIDRTDGLRVTWSNGEVLHLRPSGNAPEFRCYAEASTPARATILCAEALERVRDLAPA